jgi:hypothetical protein
MTNTELKQFYEKLYFAEIDARDKVHSRLQLPLTLIIAISGAIAFLAQNFDPKADTFGAVRVPFLFFLGGGVLFLVVAIERFVRALHGHEYHLLPDSLKTAEYRLLLDETYKDFPESAVLIADAMDSYIVGYYVQYAAYNTRVNDRRSAFLHHCTWAIIGTTLFLGAAFAIFYVADLDKGKMKTATEVLIKQPVEVMIRK